MTVRANVPVRVISRRQPSAGPGLPCTNTTASLVLAGLAWSYVPRTPPTVTAPSVTGASEVVPATSTTSVPHPKPGSTSIFTHIRTPTILMYNGLSNLRGKKRRRAVPVSKRCAR